MKLIFFIFVCFNYCSDRIYDIKLDERPKHFNHLFGFMACTYRQILTFARPDPSLEYVYIKYFRGSYFTIRISYIIIQNCYVIVPVQLLLGLSQNNCVSSVKT
jgi:hypothetical protein